MVLTKEETAALVKKFGKNEHDTGSTEVQVAILTAEIKNLTAHLKYHIHDNQSRRALFILVGKRRGLLDYLDRKDHEAYVKLIAELGIRK